MENNGAQPQIEVFRSLYRAIATGDADGFRTIASANPAVLSERYLDTTPHNNAQRMFFEAIEGNQVAIASFLLAYGASIDVAENADGPEGIIVRAVQNRAIDSVRWLLSQGATINHVVDGKTRCFAITSAARKGNLEVVRLLVEHGADFNSVWADKNALSFAIEYGHKDIEAYLRSIGAKEP